MHISLKEPIAPRYIYINPLNNRLHVLIPIVGGMEIATDNTCQSLVALKDFFGKHGSPKKNERSIFASLSRYQNALEYDIAALPNPHPLKSIKQERLEQIKSYITTLTTLTNKPEIDKLRIPEPEYPISFKKLLKEPSNLYSILLRSTSLDTETRTINPIFSVQRRDNTVLYQTLLASYHNVNIRQLPPEQMLTQEVLSQVEGRKINFEELRNLLTKKIKDLFGLDIDLTVAETGVPATRTYIENEMGFNKDAKPAEYIHGILSYCARAMWKDISISPFHAIKNKDEQQDELVILTQFFLAQVNIYCASHQLSAANFGKVLDASQPLSESLANIVKEALENGLNVENQLFEFINQNRSIFNLNDLLTSNDMSIINAQFRARYQVIKTHESLDEFTILDTNQQGKFRTHQASICTDLTELLRSQYPALENNYLKEIYEDNQLLPGMVPNTNEGIEQTFEINDNNIVLHLAQIIQGNHANVATEILVAHLNEYAQFNGETLAPLCQAKDKNNQNLLQYLIKENHPSLQEILKLFSKTQSFEMQRQKNKMGNNAIMSAILYPNIVSILLNSLDQKDCFKLLQEKNNRGDTALHLAINKPDSLKEMLKPLSVTERIQLLKIKNNSNESVQQLLNRAPTSLNVVSELLLEAIPVVRAPSSPVTTAMSLSFNEEDMKAHIELPQLALPNNEFKFCLNNSIENLLNKEERNCFIWQNTEKGQLSYISAHGDVTKFNMSVVKQFGFTTLLQTFAKTQRKLVDESTTLNLSKEDIQQLIKAAGIKWEQIFPANHESMNHGGIKFS